MKCFAYSAEQNRRQKRQICYYRLVTKLNAKLRAKYVQAIKLSTK